MTDVVTTSMENVYSTLATKIFTIVQLTYGLPSFILMIFFLFFLGFSKCSKNYGSSFYRLVQLDLLANILCYLNTWISLRIGSEHVGIIFLKELELLLPGLLTYTKFLANWFMHMQFITAIALSFHRITSMVLHLNYERIWSRWYPVFGFSCFVYSSIPGIVMDTSPVRNYIENGTFWVSYSISGLYQLRINIAIFSLIYFLCLLIVGFFTAYLVTDTFQRMSISDQGIGKKLTKIALTYCFVYAGILLYSTITAINGFFDFMPQFFNTMNSVIMVTASDMMTLSLPYILIFYDSNVRSDLAKRLRLNQSSGTDRIFVSASVTN